MTSIGILSIGTYLPPDTRTNSWWPDHVVENWTKSQFETANKESRSPLNVNDDVALERSSTEGMHKVARAMSESARNPFHGSVQRRILAEGMSPSHMQIEAAEDALRKAGLEPDAIDFIIEDSMLPARLAVPTACTVHHALGLREQTLTLSVKASCNAFAAQMELAHALCSSGRYHYGLLVQGSALGRIIPMDAPYAPLFGDGATAVVVGPVKDGFGFLASAHRTNGSLDNAMVASVPGRAWYSDGPISWHPESMASTRTMLLSVADQARQITGEALALAGLDRSDADVYASHQATSWFHRVTQDYAGLSHARSLDTFQWTGSLCGANVPFVLAVTECEGMLRDGDIVVTYSGGAGITWSSVVLRWQGAE